jgi:hypothetical protein
VTSVEVEVDKFKEQFARFQETSKRSVAQNLRQQGKLLAVDIAKRTPPGDFQATGWKRIAGERAIRADIAKIMRPWKWADARTDAKAIHEKYRRKRGKVHTDLRKSGTGKTRDGKEIQTGSKDRDGRYRVDTQTLQLYIQMVQRRVGYMAAGWAKAAQFLGASMPGWITRHSAPGAGTVNIRGEDIELTMTNAAIYPDSRGLMDRRAVAALRRRYWQIKKQTDNFIKIAAEQAGFTTGGS